MCLENSLENKIPIVVLNYNDYDTAKVFLERYKTDLTGVAELVFVDNHSDDGSFESLKEEYGQLGIFLRSEKNRGYGSGNNIGLKYIRKYMNAKKVIISNPDIVVKPEVIVTLSNLLDAHKEVKIIAPKMLDTEGREQTSAWKAQGVFRDAMSSLILINRILKLDKKVYSSEELREKSLYVDAVNGSFFMADMEAFEEIGFFDEDTFLYCEENILAYKLKKAGYKEMLVNNISYIHAHNATIGKVFKGKAKRYKLLQQSRKIYYKKYLKCGAVKRIFFDVISAIGLLERNVLELFLRK